MRTWSCMEFPSVKARFFEVSGVFHVDHVTTETWPEVHVPEGTQRLVVAGDYLDELVIPEGVVSCICCGLGLRRLVVPDSLEMLFCNRNQLRSLELPHTLYMCDISHNPLYHLRFRGDGPLELGRIQMHQVRLTTFDAKVKENCEIDMEGNPQLVNLSREVERAAYMYPFHDEEYVSNPRFYEA